MEGIKLNERIQTLTIQIERIKDEYDSLEKEAVANKTHLTNLAESRRTAIIELHQLLKERVEMINGMLGSHIGSNKKYRDVYDDLIEKVDTDKKSFFSYLQNIFSVLYPSFMTTLRSKGLTDQEMFYAYLYVLGLSGKEIGEYFNTKSHYNISSAIRQKLGLENKGANLASYLKSLIKTDQQGSES